MRTIGYEDVVNVVASLVEEANYRLPPDVIDSIRAARERETLDRAAAILDRVLENADVAAAESLPLCQDTGAAVFFVDAGGEMRVDGGGLLDAIQDGTRRGYTNGALRASIVADPLERTNTGDNTPAFIHYTPVAGDRLHIRFCPKGAGCENMSAQAMLSPGEGVEGVRSFVVGTVKRAGGKPCPPVVVGVGIGGTFEYSTILSKKALFRSLDEPHPDERYAALEAELLAAINDLNIGPMGLGGKTTALGVLIETAPCHIASLPVAVNIQCHSDRHRDVVL